MVQKYSFSWSLPTIVSIIYLFLYIPIILLVAFSFNKEALSYQWSGFTLEWYSLLFHQTPVWHALRNSIIVASCSVVLSLTIGSVYVFFSRQTVYRKMLPLFYANVGLPEIVLAVGLMSLFYAIGVPLGIVTLIASHTVLGLGYVVPIINARYVELDKRLIEAARDLGASHTQTFFSIVLPLLLPALYASGLLVFIISFDDFVLSFFCSGATSQTLPIYIFSLLRSGASPVVSALSTLLLVTSSLLVMAFLYTQFRESDEVA